MRKTIAFIVAMLMVAACGDINAGNTVTVNVRIRQDQKDKCVYHADFKRYESLDGSYRKIGCVDRRQKNGE